MILPNGGEQMYNWDFLALIEIITNACLLLIRTLNKICSWILFILLENRRSFFLVIEDIFYKLFVTNFSNAFLWFVKTGWSSCSCWSGCPNWCCCTSWQHRAWSIPDLFLPGLSPKSHDDNVCAYSFWVFFLQHSSVACLVLAVFLLTLIATLFFSTGAQYSNQD